MISPQIMAIFLHTMMKQFQATLTYLSITPFVFTCKQHSHSVTWYPVDNCNDHTQVHHEHSLEVQKWSIRLTNCCTAATKTFPVPQSAHHISVGHNSMKVHCYMSA